MSIEKLSTIWPEWRDSEYLGEGSFGKVYKVVREGHGVTSTSAVKVISIPQNDAELSSIRAEGLDEAGTHSYFKGIVTDFVNEIKLMESMKGTSNIVSVEDYKVLEKTDKIGWDIFIRMELLTPLNDYIADKTLTESEVIKLGQDVCSALELCAQRNIIHRDIKPENIFVSSFGDFKVGDFGIARELEKTSGSLSQKGTYNYMAPEITISKHYDSTVDIYSLGLVLYKLLNNNRLPFIDPTAQLIQYQERKDAIDRRFRGETLPAPINASASLANIILTACAFEPAERFKTPTAFKNALGAVVGQKPSTAPASANLDINATTAVRRAPKAAQPSSKQKAREEVPTDNFGKEKKAKGGLVAVIVVLALLVVGTGGFLLNPGGIFDGVHEMVDSIGGDPVSDVITALEDGNYEEALALAEEIEDGALQARLEERLSTLATEFRDETIEFSVASMELDTIGRMDIPELTAPINTTRTSINNLNNSRAAYNTAVTFFERGNYAQAIEQYSLVIQDDPNYESARDGVRRATEAYRNAAIAAAGNYSEDGNYVRAIRILEEALLVIQSDAEITQQLNIYRVSYTAANRQRVLDTAAGYADDDNWPNAIATLNAALRNMPGDTLITERLRSYEQSYVTIVVSESNNLVSANRHDDAIALITQALQVIPDNEQLSIMRDDVTEARPISLLSLTPVNSSRWTPNSGVLEDSLGNHYEAVMPFIVIPDQSFGEFFVRQEFSTLRGRLAPHRDLRQDRTASIRVYADGQLVYASPEISRTTLPFDFEVNISGAQFITVRNTGTHWGHILALDMVLER